MSLKAGKLEIDALKGLLEKYTILDPQVVIGPRIGEDAAVIDLGKGTDDYWVVTSDPITFTAALKHVKPGGEQYLKANRNCQRRAHGRTKA